MAATVAVRTSSGNSGGLDKHMDSTGKYVRYTAEQVEALERVYAECPKPSSMRRQQLVRECPILNNIEPKQIKVWFQNRRCREKQRKESSRLQAVNRKLTAMNKLLMEENERLQKQVAQLVHENAYMKQQLQNASLANDTSCESAVTTPQNPLRDATNPAGLLSIAEETLAEFLSKATGTAVDWVQMPGMKPGPDSIGIVTISQTCSGVAARACGLVSLEPTKIAEILKDRPSWFRDCRSLEVFTVFPAGNGGTIELVYMQMFAPTTLAPARDLWTLRYTAKLDDGSLVVCERSLSGSGAGPGSTSAHQFVRAQMLPSGFLIRPCDGGGSIVHIVDHLNLEAWSVPEVLRPLYESSRVVAQKMTITNVSPALLVKFLREHRSEWADYNMDAYSASSLKAASASFPGLRPTRFSGSQTTMRLAHTVENEEFLEVIRLDGHVLTQDEDVLSRDIHLLQLCSGMDENAVGVCYQLVFAPIDELFPDDAPLLPSGFCVIPLDTRSDGLNSNRTLDLTSSLEVGSAANRGRETSPIDYSLRSVLSIAFQFPYELHLQESVAAMARQYVRDIVSAVQRVAMAITQSRLGPSSGDKLLPGSPEAVTLTRWICDSYNYHLGLDLLRSTEESGESLLKMLWDHQDAILCCSFKTQPVFTFANQAGLDMLETTLIALQDITLDKIFEEPGRWALCSDFAKLLEQGYSYLPGGVCLSGMGRHVSYEQAVGWKVVGEDNSVHCLAFCFMNWSFV